MSQTGDMPRVILREELERLKGRIIANHLKAGQKASGRTMQSLRVESGDEDGVLFGRSPFGTLETGRKPGRVPQRFYLVIRQWMKDKGINADPMPYKTNRAHKYTEEERGARSLAFFIARKIQREGTSLFRKGGRSDIYSNEIPETVQRIGDRMMKVIQVMVDSIKLNNKVEIK